MHVKQKKAGGGVRTCHAGREAKTDYRICSVTFQPMHMTCLRNMLRNSLHRGIKMHKSETILSRAELQKKWQMRTKWWYAAARTPTRTGKSIERDFLTALLSLDASQIHKKIDVTLTLMPKVMFAAVSGESGENSSFV